MINIPEIQSIELIEINNIQIIVNINITTVNSNLEPNCCGGLGLGEIEIEYALYDVYYNLLQDFLIIPNLPNPLISTDIYTIPNPLVAKCKIHISGLLLSGGFGINNSNFTTIGIEDSYSELLGPGDYPDATLVIPKSISLSSTLDSIAIPPGMRIIYYRDKNFTGEIVLDQIGPALIWNKVWIPGYNTLYDQTLGPFFDDDFLDAGLQAIYPQSKRFWSSSHMSDFVDPSNGWGNGSFKIFCTNIDAEPCHIAFRLACKDPDPDPDPDPILFDNNSWKVSPFVNNIPSNLVLLLDEAADTWKNIVKFDEDIVTSIRDTIPSWSGITINSYEKADYGPGPIAACSVESAISLGGNKYNTLNFNLNINSYYWDNPQNVNFSWTQVLIHELGHALGIGTLWDTLDNIWLDGSSYPLSQAGYNGISNINRLKIPLEDTGGGGTAGAHWEDNDRTSDEQFYPGIIDIMQGTINNFSIGPVTVGFLKDLGYVDTSTQSGSNIMINNNFITPDMKLLQNPIHSPDQFSNPRCGCGCHEHFPHTEPKIILLYDVNTKKIIRAPHDIDK